MVVHITYSKAENVQFFRVQIVLVFAHSSYCHFVSLPELRKKIVTNNEKYCLHVYKKERE